ncbi:EFR1 family ferrodoxin [Lacrimispora indolis]|uniref:EFR1 family ferrodoxin n=1 Tax=Lacrimispora indolis TaxID=69825 RepID=UPI003563631E
MNISQITGVYFSPTGSTKRVTEWITERIADNREAEWLDLTDAVSSRPDYTFTEHELAVVGVPVYGGRVPETARGRLQKLHGKRTPAVLIVTYGNRAYEDALLELSDILKEQGFIPAAAAAVVTEHNIAHVYGAGRPDEKDKKEMTAFAEAVREKLKRTAGSTKLLELSIRGNRPYRPYGTLPLKISVSSACEGCGTCIRKCPVQAISRTDAKVTDESACITCMRCIAVCPKHARKLGTLMTLAIRQKLKKVCTDRKDAEFVL